MADLTLLYMKRTKQLGVVFDKRVHTTRLRERLLRHFPNLKEHEKVKDVLFEFQEEFGSALTTTCDYDCDCDAVHLAKATRIIRKNMHKQCQTDNF